MKSLVSALYWELNLFQNPFKYMNTIKRVLPQVTENALTLDLTKSVEYLAWTLFL